MQENTTTIKRNSTQTITVVEQLLKIFAILVTLVISHFDISGKDDNDEQLLNNELI